MIDLQTLLWLVLIICIIVLVYLKCIKTSKTGGDDPNPIAFDGVSVVGPEQKTNSASISPDPVLISESSGSAAELLDLCSIM